LKLKQKPLITTEGGDRIVLTKQPFEWSGQKLPSLIIGNTRKEQGGITG